MRATVLTASTEMEHIRQQTHWYKANAVHHSLKAEL